MRTLLWKLFPPYEVGATKATILKFLDAHDGIARPRVEEIVFQYLHRNPKTIVDTIRLNQKTVDYVALSILTALLRLHLTSGNYHTYRGSLSIIGENMMSLWSVAVAEMVTKGFATPEDANDARLELTQEIRSVG